MVTRTHARTAGLLSIVGLGAALTIVGACGGGGAPVVKPTEPGDAPPVVAPSVPELEGRSGFVFAPEGGPVELRVLATGESIAVDDGTPLVLLNEQSGEGFGRAEAEVDVGGKVGILPNPSVLVGERMRRSPVSKVVLFMATSGCDPRCASEVWALHPDGRRLQVASGLHDATFAFSPDGRQIAVGGDGLFLLQIGTWRVFKYKEFTAPSFAPDSALFVRSRGESDTVLQLYFGGQAAEIVTEPGTPASPVLLPVTFEDGGKTVVAVFARAGGDKIVRTSR